MYLFLIISLILIVICFVFLFFRRRKAIKKTCAMTQEEKCSLLQDILYPYGYCYLPKQDVVSTHNDAWQRGSGYTAFFDRAALHFNMVFDALPIYFHYQGKTWLIEFWKGQYGINTGAEIGIYYADRILSSSELSTAHFQAVEDSERLPVAFTLYKDCEILASASGKSWWLTAFLVGSYAKPDTLSMDIEISFPNIEMQASFLEALKRVENPHFAFHCRNKEVHIHYSCGCPISPICSETITIFRRIRIAWTQFCNRWLCRLYCAIAHPFETTLDRIVFLYELLPYILRRMLRHLKGVISK